MPAFFRKPEAALTAVLALTATVLFWPVLSWIGRETAAHEQLRQSLALMVFAVVFVLFDQWGKLKPAFELTNRNLLLLLTAFLIASVTLVWPNPYPVLAGLGLAFFALARIVFGSRAMPVYLPFAITFAGFLLLVLFLPILDWPLRALAGGYASHLLELFGHRAHLTLIHDPAPTLLLLVDEQIFEVAAECNGFGLMSTAALLSLLLCVPQAMPLWWKAAAVALAVLVGFGFNLVRIIGIVLAAPHVPDHYDLMHETVGLIALFAGLTVVWLLIGSGKRPEPSEAQTSASV